MKTCTLCGVRPRELPDRNMPGRPIKRVCRVCHAARLRGDLQRIIEADRLAREYKPDGATGAD